MKKTITLTIIFIVFILIIFILKEKMPETKIVISYNINIVAQTKKIEQLANEIKEQVSVIREEKKLEEVVLSEEKETAKTKEEKTQTHQIPEESQKQVKPKVETASSIITKGTWGEYGKSFKGQSLQYFKIGTGKNKLFVVAEQHGWEDKWAGDGIELTKIANNLIEYLERYNDATIFEKWTIYILPKANPDGLTYGTTKDGVGRTTYEGYDLNRVYDTSNFQIYTNSRNYTGDVPFLAQEATAIRDLMIQVKSNTKGKIVVIDLHGWLNQTIGDPHIGSFYNKQFNMSNKNSWGAGYLVTWAKEKLGAKASLVELPEPKNAQDVLNRDFSGKFIKGTINLLHEVE